MLAQIAQSLSARALSRQRILSSAMEVFMALRARPPDEIRISFGALLRIREDDRYVLFHSANRPDSWSPPGGVFKFFEPASGLLDRLGFRVDRIEALAEVMRCDVRGFIPSRSLPGLLAWFESGAYREDSAECLRRELVEELAEVGLSAWRPAVTEMAFRHVRTVMEGPKKLADRPYRQLRRLEVHDLVVAGSLAARARQELLDAGADAGLSTVVCASAAEIRHGRCGTALIGGNSEYLVGPERIAQELPPLR